MSPSTPTANGKSPQQKVTDAKAEVDSDDEEDEEMKPIDLADRSASSDGELRIAYLKKDVGGEDDDDDEDEEIEVDDIDDRFDEKKKTSSYYEDSVHTDDNSNDAKTSSETRLPILKSMLSPSDQQTEEKIGKCALLSTSTSTSFSGVDLFAHIFALY